ncbi:MAG: alpha/beta hydrolase [Calditrichaceae bacterium]|nr:alpha/beta hydrolase [Calditrichaceae bacterium]
MRVKKLPKIVYSGLFLFLIACGLFEGDEKNGQTDNDVMLTENVNYGTNESGGKLWMDMFIPVDASSAPWPCVIYIHGSGWRAGNKKYTHERCIALSKRGYVVATINYTLSDEACWRAQIYDCKTAVRFMRANSDLYNINPDKIGAWGGSAGAHLALMLGTTNNVGEMESGGGNNSISGKVSAVCSWNGPTWLINGELNADYLEILEPFLGVDYEENPSLFETKANDASPINWISGRDVPMLLVYSENDPVVLYETQCLPFYNKASDSGLSVTLTTTTNYSHGYKDDLEIQLIEETCDWFDGVFK